MAGPAPTGVRRALGASLLSTIVVGGDSLQIDSGLPAASVNVLMALLLLMVFGFGRRTEKVASVHDMSLMARARC